MPTHPKNVAVWFEIPTKDLDRSIAFYNAVLDQDMKIDNTGPNPMADFIADPIGGVAGHIYPGTPSEHGPTVHFVAPDGLDATRARIVEAGGKVESPDIPLPAGAFFYARDLDGNSIGIFEYNS